MDALGIYSIKNDYEENIISGTTEQVAETNYQIGQLYQVQGTSEGLSVRDIILKNLQMNYTGLNSNYQIDSDSIILSNVKVQFCKDEAQGSMPQ